MDAIPLTPETVRRNVRWSTLNQFFVEAGMTFTEGGTVLVLFVRALGGSTFLAGLLPSLHFAGWLLPQFFAAGRLQRLTRMMPAVQALEGVRATFYLAAGALALTLGLRQPGVVLALFFLFHLITRIAAGSSAVARAEMVRLMVPPSERATLVSLRHFGGGVAGLLCGLAVRYILDPGVSRFPTNYGLLFLISGVCFVLAIVTLSLARETARSNQQAEVRAGAQLRRAPALLRRDRRFARYVAARAAASGFELAAPFYILYASEQLGAPAALAGIYISMRTFARVASNLYWGRKCRVWGSLQVMRAGLLVGILAPLVVVLFLIAVPADSALPGHLAWLFGVVFLVDGTAHAAYGIGTMTYLYDLAPEGELPTYFGLTNTILGPLHFLPALGGALLGVVGFGPIFGAAAGLLALALGITLQMGERPQVAPA